MEEIDYHWKCNLMGYSVWVEPTSLVYHYGGYTLKSDSPYKTFLNHRNSLILLLSNYSIGLSLYLFLIRFPLEIISSIKELLTFRIGHFFSHYLALFALIIKIPLIISKRGIIKKIRKVSDWNLLEQKNIFNKSVVRLYYLNNKKKFIELN